MFDKIIYYLILIFLLFNLNMNNEEILSILEEYPDYKDSFIDQDKPTDENYIMYIIINGSVKMKKVKLHHK